MSHLFDPLALGPVTVDNRIMLSPMCQYSSDDGVANDWHLAHLLQMAMGGMGLIMTEATHVSAPGRISPHCLGLYSDACETGLARVVSAIRAHRECPIGVQLAHAGRKGANQRPWDGGGALPADQTWLIVAPSALAHADGWQTPQALDEAGLTRIKEEFVESARRAARIGFDVVEVHAAHGYLLHEFLSPHSNRREDNYGGSAEARRRYPLEVLEAVRAVWPADKALGVRVSATDYIPDGLSVEDVCDFVAAARDLGCDFVDVSGGGVAAVQQIDLAPGYQVDYATTIKRAVGLPTFTVGLITNPTQANDIITSGRADGIALARAFLRNPRWVWDAADELGAEVFCPPQYVRGRHPRHIAGLARPPLDTE
jgi:2,4-dienoyl-CoA reductase-like NADH-dependent reductase (Old Yellow Enzyme family)